MILAFKLNNINVSARCHVDRYQPSKSQKKVAKKVGVYIVYFDPAILII